MTRTKIEHKLAETLDELSRIGSHRGLSVTALREIRARVLADVGAFIDAKFEAEVAAMREVK